MNRLTIIGNLTRDPVLRTTRDGTEVCDFTVAVNRRVKQGQEQQADYFRVTTWREQAKSCNTYLAKGKKVAVIGEVSVHTYTDSNGQFRAQMELAARDVEFLTPRADSGQQAPQNGTQAASEPQPDDNGFIPVETDDLPF